MLAAARILKFCVCVMLAVARSRNFVCMRFRLLPAASKVLKLTASDRQTDQIAASDMQTYKVVLKVTFCSKKTRILGFTW